MPRQLRVLVLIAADNTVRNFVDTGAFAGLEPGNTSFVTSSGGVGHEKALSSMRSLPGYVGAVDDPRPEAQRPYKFLRMMLLAATRRRSRTMSHKLSMLPWRKRLLYKAAALPGIHDLTLRAAKRRAGLSSELLTLMQDLRPDVVIAPSNGYDPLVWDGVRTARALGIPSLALIANWDNLSSKGVFAERPDYLGAWGEQGVDHAEYLHGIPRERVRPLGAPQFEHYFRHVPGSSASPFSFRYVLFAGCFAPFDELSALKRLEDLIEEHSLDLKVVYRPHPHRYPRDVSDFVDEAHFRNVVIDPQVQELYAASSQESENWHGPQRKRLKPLLPPLEYYPALLENAEFVVCPLSTMIVEAAIFERPVVVVAYDDGIHENSPASVVNYEHFDGIDRIDGFRVCTLPEQLDAQFLALAQGDSRENPSLREQLLWWLHYDDRPYSERLGAWVDEIAEREGLPGRRGPPKGPAERVAQRPGLIS